jgi:hypothetical protein
MRHQADASYLFYVILKNEKREYLFESKGSASTFLFQEYYL